MINSNLAKYPPSYTYDEIIKKLGKGKRVAYCYMGTRVGTIVITHDNDFKMFSPSNKIGSYTDKNQNHEFWAFIDDIEDNDFRSSALNHLFYIYCNFYHILYEEEIDLFKNI